MFPVEVAKVFQTYWNCENINKFFKRLRFSFYFCFRDKKEIQNSIRKQRERNEILVRSSNELHSELQEVVEQRISLEIQLEHLKPCWRSFIGISSFFIKTERAVLCLNKSYLFYLELSSCIPLDCFKCARPAFVDVGVLMLFFLYMSRFICQLGLYGFILYSNEVSCYFNIQVYYLF